MSVNTSSLDALCTVSTDNHACTLIFCHCLITIIALFGNSLIIYAVIKYKHLRNCTNILIVSLAISDLLTALTIPYYASFYLSVPYKCDKYPCLIRYLLSLFTTLWSLLLMIGIAIERYLAVLKPLRYKSIVRSQRIGVFVTSTGIYMGIICALPLSDVFNTYDMETFQECDLVYIVGIWYASFVVCFHVALTIGVTSALYWRTFAEAFRHHSNSPNAFNVKLGRNLTVMMMTMLGVRVFFLLPYMLAVIARYQAPDSSQHMISNIKKFTTVLYFCKAITNPFICWRNEGFRLAFRQILGIGKVTTPDNICPGLQDVT